MLYERFHVTFVGVVATLVDSVVVAEFAGYWLHRLLHSDLFRPLSRGHLIHHFLSYGPGNPCAPGSTTTRRAAASPLADSNFGTGFYLFDRFFRTTTKHHRPFNWQGCQAAIARYGLEETEFLSLRACSQALFHKESQNHKGRRREPES
jgi:hypothetical protein